MYSPSGENKGTDQLCSCCEAYLRFCFRIGKILVFLRRGSNGHAQLLRHAMERPVFMINLCYEKTGLWGFRHSVQSRKI